MNPPARVLSTVAKGGGRLLSAATSAVAAVRPAAKPLHPRGTVLHGTLHRSGTAARPAAWCDEAGVDEVLVRRSRAVGLPPLLPDVHGLAVRVRTDDGPADLLFATTGFGRITRFTLTPAWTAHGRPMTTLLPYRSPHGPLLLGAVADPRADDRWALLCASPGGRWTPFGRLRLHDPVGPTVEDDADLSFDPVRHTAPGLENYAWVRRLREPAYLTARRSRTDAP